MKRVFISAVVFSISLALLWVDARATGRRRERLEGSTQLIPWPVEEITSIEIVRAGQPLELRKKDGVWQITRPIETPADPQAVGDLLYYLTLQRKYAEHPADSQTMESFGLKDSALSFVVSADDGQVEVRVGAQSPVSGEVYAANRDGASYYTIGRNLKDHLYRPLYDYRDKSLLPFNANDATTLSLTTNGQTVLLARGEEGWRLLRPFEAKAEDETVDQILREIQSTRASDFQDTDTLQLDRYGLSAPSVVAIFEAEAAGAKAGGTGEEKQILRATLLIGAPVDKEARKRFAMRPDRDTVFALPETLVSLFGLDPLDLKSGEIFTLTEREITRFEIFYGKKGIALERKADGVWRFADESPWKVDQQYASKVLSFILKIRAQRYFDFVPTDEMSGLDRPFLRITLAGGRGERVEGIETGKTGNGPRTRDIVFARKLDTEEVFGIPANRPGKLFLTIEKFRDKSILDIRPEDVAEVIVKGVSPSSSLGFTVVFERTPHAYWLARTLPDGKPFNVGGHLVDAMILGAENLRWKKILDPTRKADREKIDLYRLDAAPLTIEFYDREKKMISFVAQGDQSKGDPSRGLIYIGAGEAESPQYFAVETSRYVGFSAAIAALLRP